MEKLTINKDSDKDRLSMDTMITREYNSFYHSRTPSYEGYKNFNLSLNESKEKKEEINYSRDENLKSLDFNIDDKKKLISETLNKISTNKENYKQDLLKLFIYIYFYEKALSEKNIFLKSQEEYYLINPDWLTKFKDFYSYHKFQEKLEMMKLKFNYHIIDSNIENIISSIPDEIKPDDKPLLSELKKINTLYTNMIKLKNIRFIKEGIILPSKIIYIIKNIIEDSKDIFPKKKIIFKDNYIYYIKNEKIIIGNFLYSALFIPNYVFSYNSVELEKKEENKLLSSNINEYIEQKHCDPREANQILKNEKGEEIGSLIITSENKQKSQEIKNPKNINFGINDKNNYVKNFFNNTNKTHNAIEVQSQKKENLLIKNINYCTELNNEKQDLKINKIAKEEIISLEEEKLQLIQELKENKKQLINTKSNSDKKNQHIRQRCIQLAIVCEFNEELDKLKKENNILHFSNNKKEKELINLKLEIEQMKKNNEKLLSFKNKEQEVSKKIQDLEEKQKYFNNLQEKFIKVEKQNKDLENNIKVLLNQKKNVIEEIKLHQKQILNQQELINIKNKFINDLNKFNQEMEQKINQISNIEINKTELDKFKKENDILKQKNINIENELNILKSSYRAKEQDIENMNKVLNEKDISLRTINQKYNMLEKQNKALENENIFLENQKEKIIEEIKQIEGQMENQKELININNNLKYEINNLNKLLENKYKETLNNRNEINRLINERNFLRQNNSEQEGEINEMKKQIYELKKKEFLINNREKEIDNKNKELNAKNMRLYKSIEKHKNLNQENDRLVRNISELKQQKKNLLEIMKQYTEQISAQENIINNNKHIEDLNNKLKQKNEQIDYKNKEIVKLKNENNLLIKKCNNKDKEINDLKKNTNNTNNQMQKNKTKSNLFQKEEQKISNKMKVSEEKELIKDIKQEEQIISKNETIKKIEEEKKSNNKMQSDINNTTNISNQINQILMSNEKLLEKENEIQINPKISPNQITNAIFPLNNPLPTPLEDNNLILHPPFLSGYLKPPLIGLTKIEPTGYKNSVLQCLSQTAELTKYFLKESNKEKILNNNNSISKKNEIKLCPVYYDLIHRLWKKDASYKFFSSDNFMKTLETILKNEQDKNTPGGPGEKKDFNLNYLD